MPYPKLIAHDITPYWFAVAGGAILLLILILKLTVFRGRKIVPVENVEAPNGYDPLMVGKLIDNTVNSEDITSMVYYWADKKYIKINFDNKSDPVLIKIVKSLPDGCPDYEKIMFRGIFASGNSVKISSLDSKFRATAQTVTAKVNSHTKGLFTSKSIIIAIIFALSGGLLPGLAPFVLGLRIASNHLFILPFISLLPALVIFGLAEHVKYLSLKISKKKMALLCGGIALLCAVFCVLYIILVPTYLMDYLSKSVILVVSALAVCLSVSLITKSRKYTEELGWIVGFKNFIVQADKYRLEKLIEDNPQYYYHILPYAQVLGVSDIWEKKFEELTVPPPVWATGGENTASILKEFNAINSVIKHGTALMAAKLMGKSSAAGDYTDGSSAE